MNDKNTESKTTAYYLGTTTGTTSSAFNGGVFPFGPNGFGGFPLGGSFSCGGGFPCGGFGLRSLRNRAPDSYQQEQTPYVRRPQKYQNSNEEYSRPGNPYAQYQLNPYTTFIGAAISPAIIPFNPSQYPADHSHFRPSKSSSEKQSSNEVSYDSSEKNHVRKDKPANPVYFDFLNTYKPSQNYPNLPIFKDADSYSYPYPYQYTHIKYQFKPFNDQTNAAPSFPQAPSDNQQAQRRNSYISPRSNVHPSYAFNGQFPIPSNFH